MNRKLFLPINLLNDNNNSQVCLKSLIINESFLNKSNSNLLIPIGLNESGEYIYKDIKEMPHLLISGISGSGKSVFIHSVINSLLYTNDSNTLKFVLFDFKQAELHMYKDLPNLLLPIIQNFDEGKSAICYLLQEMNNRFSLLKQAEKYNLDSYNNYAKENNKSILPSIVVIFDEVDCFLSGKEILNQISMLVAKGRAVGIHFIFASQLFDSYNMPATIKANIPVRIAFRMNSIDHSVFIVNSAKAIDLKRYNQIVCYDQNNNQIINTPFISMPEIRSVVEYIKENKEKDD